MPESETHRRFRNTAGVLLAGGGSRRMGREKAAIRFDGKPLLARAADVLGRVFGTVVVCSAPGGTPRARELLGTGAADAETVFVEDIYPGRGPVAGIHAAMEGFAADYYFVAACDMPFLDEGACASMAGEAAGAGCDVLVPRMDDGRLHTLHAVYGRGCLPHIRRQLEAGRGNRIVEFFPGVRVCYINEGSLKKFDERLLFLLNVNDEKELEEARKFHESLS